MTNTCHLSSGRYTIRTNGQYVGLDGNRVVVGTRAKCFTFQKYDNGQYCTYVITPEGGSKHVDFKANWQIELSTTRRHWTISYLNGSAYTIRPSGSIHGWTDPGPGIHPRQLYLGPDHPLEEFIITKC